MFLCVCCYVLIYVVMFWFVSFGYCADFSGVGCVCVSLCVVTFCVVLLCVVMG